MKITVQQQDIDREYWIERIGDGYTWHAADNPVSIAIMREVPGTSVFINHQYINVFREINYWIKVPDQVLNWLIKYSQLTHLKSLHMPNGQDKQDIERLALEIKPLTFDLELPPLTAKQRKAAIAAKEQYLAELAELAE